MRRRSQILACIGARCAAVLAGLSVAGCPSVCKRPPAGMVARTPAAAPHVALAVPLATANAWIAASLPRLGPVALPMPRLAALLPQLDRIAARVKAAELLPADTEGAVLGVTLEVQHEQVPLATMSARARLRPAVDGWKVTLALRPADIETLKPQLAPGARVRIESVLLGRLPEVVRRFVPRGQVASLADALVGYLGTQAYPLLRKALLARLGDLTSLSFDLPRVPLRTARLRSLATPVPHLLIEIHTPLPVRRGLLTYRVQDDGLVHVTLAGSAVAELGNCAMISGLLPRRYDGGFKPAAQGTRWPRFDWDDDDAWRPLKIHVTKTDAPCLDFRLGARPQVKLEHGELAVGIVDGALEHVDGSAMVQLGAWLKNLGAPPIALTKKLVTQIDVRVGGKALAFALHDVALGAGMLVFGVRVGQPGPAPAPAAARGKPSSRPVASPAPGVASKPKRAFEMICGPR